MYNFIIEQTDEGMRIDKFLMNHLSDISRSKVQQLITDGLIVVNEESVKANYKLKIDDEVKVLDLNNEPFTVVPLDKPLDIRYEDDDIIIINKPQGMVVHPGAGKETDSVVARLLAYTDQLSDVNGPIRRGIVHRIDKDTSGLLVVAKNNSAHEQLAKDLQDHLIVREYVCLVHGEMPHDYGTIDAPIGRDPRNRLNMTVTEVNAKEAVTHFEVIQRFNQYTLLKCKLETGRTHQIRVHLKYIGFPIVGDTRYTGNNRFNVTMQMLHAQQLTLNQPTTHESIVVSAPMPALFERVLKEVAQL